MADNLVLGRGKILFSPYLPGNTTGGTPGYFGNTPTLNLAQTNTKLDHYSSEGGLKVKDKSIILQTDVTLTFDTDNIDLGNLTLWFGGSGSGTLPSDAPAGVGAISVIGKANAIYGAMQFLSDNPVGNNVNYWFPYINLAPNGTYALKGDAWQTLSFTAEVLKRDAATERLYIFTPTLPAGNAYNDTTPLFTPNSAGVGSGGTPATSGTATATTPQVHAVPFSVGYTLTGGTIAYLVANNGTANVGTPQLISGASGTATMNIATAGTYTIKVTSDSAGATVIGTSSSVTVS